MSRTSPAPRPRVDRTEATRRRLLVAALKVVGRHGYAGTSIGRITRRARVALGTFYTHFESQQDLFDQLLPHLGEQLLASIREKLAGIDGTAAREAAGFDAFFEFLAQYPEFYRVLNEAEVFAPRAHAAHLQNMVQGYQKAFGHARERGEMPAFARAEFEPVIYMLLGARQYLAMRYPASPGAAASALPAPAREAYLKIFSGGLLAQAPGATSVPSADRPADAGCDEIRISGQGAGRKASAQLLPGVRGARPADRLLTGMEGLAIALTDPPDEPGPHAWYDVHYQGLAPAGQLEATHSQPTGIRLNASLRADGRLVEVLATAASGEPLAICTFRPLLRQAANPMPAQARASADRSHTGRHDESI